MSSPSPFQSTHLHVAAFLAISPSSHPAQILVVLFISFITSAIPIIPGLVQYGSLLYAQLLCRLPLSIGDLISTTKLPNLSTSLNRCSNRWKFSVYIPISQCSWDVDFTTSFNSCNRSPNHVNWGYSTFHLFLTHLDFIPGTNTWYEL